MSAMFRESRKLLGILLIPMLALLFVGCSSDDSPTGPGGSDPDPEPEIKTPVGLIIQSIKVDGFNNKKTNGDDWDWDPLSATNRRADIYAILGKEGQNEDFKSERVDNAINYNTHDLTDEAGSSDKSLPMELTYNTLYTISLYDYDLTSADDLVGTLDIRPSDFYGDDNAQNYSAYWWGSDNVKFLVSGVWVYQ